MSLLDRLKRLHYRKVGEETLEPGEYRVSGDTIDVFLHEFQYPWEKAEGYWLRIETHDGLITRLVDAAADRELPSAEIEPELIARFFGEHQEDRDLIRYVEVSPHLKNAIVTTEDQRFYRHWGFDPLGFTRAMLKNLVSLRFVQGGSTLTQQLVKNFYLTSERTITRKAKEAVMAFVLEMIYAKDAIFEAYMNEIYFAQEGSVSISGVGQASRYYFGRDVRTLGLAESALLAGLIRHPAGYNPVKRMERAKARRDYIIKRMLDAEMITPEEANEALAEDVKVLNRKPARTIAPYYIAFLKSQLDKRYGADILISEGLSIFTTLDVQAQKNAERAVDEGLAELESKYDRLKKVRNRSRPR
ncbi:MAG: transglycosylase domain-containing protein [Deltaproteobacteria bacterium]|nr:transglycosylase domain-containing protein [Deltaproteobacteria bacterium]